MPRQAKQKDAVGPVKWVTIKVRPETKRIIELIATAERLAVCDVADEMAHERWDRVKQSDLLP